MHSVHRHRRERAAGRRTALVGDPTAFLRGCSRGPLSETELTRRRLSTLDLMLVLVIKTACEYTDTGRYAWARRQLAHTMAPFERHSRLK